MLRLLLSSTGLFTTAAREQRLCADAVDVSIVARIMCLQLPCGVHSSSGKIAAVGLWLSLVNMYWQ